MKYSDRLEKAIHIAGKYHKNQCRKGEDRLPYITHLFSVAIIVSNYSKDEDTIIAALLHDVFEDTNYKEDEMVKDFGTHVRDIVLEVTEPDGATTWKERKEGYILGLKSASQDGLLIAAADKKHNFSSIVKEYEKDKSSFFKEFSGTVESRIKFYGEIVEIIKSRLDSSIVKELEEVFCEYKLFLQQD